MELARWEIALLAVAGYVAIVSLVRLMVRRRDELVSDLREKIRAEQLRKKTTAKVDRKKQKKQDQDEAA